MNGKVFLDTNIIVYAHTDYDRRKQITAQKLIREEDTCISTQVLQETANILSKKFNQTWADIIKVLQDAANNSKLHNNSQSTILLACKIAGKYKYSFYDSLIIAASVESDCEQLLSEDLHDGQEIEKSLTIINPFSSSIKKQSE
ncbi:MAG: PIN domain-containing protein [Cyclobacteriaceae bacterium]|nr:PIN domain-containing protein [Cyclobacteriaceae bacterium]